MDAPPLWSRFSADPRSHSQVRASDADRAVVTDVVSEAYALGQIDAEELDERIESAGRVKTLGEIPDLVQDLIIAEAGDLEPKELDGPARAQALARLEADRIPITPEQINAAAERYYKDRVRRSLVGLVAGPVGITTVIWAITSFASHQFIFFWPIFVMIPMILGAISQIAHKDDVIRNRRRELTQRARAQLGDAEAKRQIEEHKQENADYEESFGEGLQPPHPLAPPYSSGGHSSRNERHRRREERRRQRGNPWN
ncbi:DUF1707 domain-containing protein [Brevibacterium sp. ZH18]|uniref:DUF1707 SHOCT-like domain-containing protein n=1 Tax=Brevibacterium sp. ZH18 TaxID=2927784 RepID=UPI001F611485|nr:DUF1707 domain-containing protein [Brevibacterium sp. ZH18]MCI4012493.1 DUF1707 domain-containing protein [Brevibacterium sp. ZH18]